LLQHAARLRQVACDRAAADLTAMPSSCGAWLRMFASLRRVVQTDRHRGQERITASSRIKAIARRLKAEHQLLCVTVPGCEQSANTAVLGLDEQRGLLYLDELNVEETHQALLSGRKLRIDCRLQGMELKFATVVLNVEHDAGLALYEVALPRLITRVQRRENFRLRLSPGLTVPITVPALEGETVNGEAFDLSATGIGAFLQTRLIPAPGKVLSGVTLSLPRSRPLKARIEIRFARQNATQHMLRIGARFVDLERSQERQIARFLAEQQRKRRRHEPR
jgi:flagellar brake protein